MTVGPLIASLVFSAFVLIATTVARMLPEPDSPPHTLSVGNIRRPDVEQLILTLISGITGAFSATRDTPLDVLAVTGFMIGCIAGTILARHRHDHLATAFPAFGLFAVVFVIMIDGAWNSLIPIIVASLPFVATYYVIKPNRIASLRDALIAGAAGASFGTTGAIFILIVAALAAICVAQHRKIPANTIVFYPYLAVSTILGIFFATTFKI